MTIIGERQRIMTSESFNAAERIERLPMTSYQLKIFSAIGIAWLCDVIDIGMMGYALGPVKKYFDLNATQAGLLGSSSFAGMFVGATLSGILGDKYGRKKIFQLSIFIWGIASIFCAIAGSIELLVLFRFLLGIGMGMEFPVGQSLVCELTSTKYRGRSVAALTGFMPVGAVICGIIALLILPVAGWRGLFVVQGLLAILAIAPRRFIPESPRWLEKSGQLEESNRILTAMEDGVAVALGGKPLPEPHKLETANDLALAVRQTSNTLRSIWSSIYARRTLMLWLAWFFILMGYHGLRTWLASLLQAKGYSIMESTSYILTITLAGIPGFACAFWLVERWGRKPTLVATVLGAAFSYYLYGNAGSLPQIIFYGLMTQFFMFAVLCPLYVYTPELYPTNVRATGSGCASGFGRLGAMFGPTMVGIILTGYGQSAVFTSASAVLIIAALVVLILGEETKGLLLEKISPQL